MGLIEDYVELYDGVKTPAQMAGALGVYQGSVTRAIRDRPVPKTRPLNMEHTNSVSEEYNALVYLIQEMSSPEKRKTGIILEIAKRRLQDLENNMNY